MAMYGRTLILKVQQNQSSTHGFVMHTLTPEKAASSNALATLGCSSISNTHQYFGSPPRLGLTWTRRQR
jgi:hypothetical protein